MAVTRYFRFPTRKQVFTRALDGGAGVSFGLTAGVTEGFSSGVGFGLTDGCTSGLTVGLASGVGSTEGVTTVELSKVFVCALTEKQQLY